MRRLDIVPDTFPTLKAGDFALRAVLPSDAADWHRYLSDPRVHEHTSSAIMSLPEVDELIAMFAGNFLAKTQMRWAVTRAGDGKMVGDCGYNHFWDRDNRGEIGYQLAPEYWGKGVMTTAVSAMINYGFSELALNKIQATVNVNNQRSAKLLRRLGFQLEGTLRDYRNRQGVYSDSWFFGLLKREWTGH